MRKIKKIIKKIKSGALKKALNEFLWICKKAKNYSKAITGYVALSIALVIISSILGVSVGDMVNYFADRNINAVVKLVAFYLSFGIVNIILAMVKQRAEARILNR